jgi:SAM-dependent methyltransferase
MEEQPRNNATSACDRGSSPKHRDSLGYWSGRAQEYSALHRKEYDSPKQKLFEALVTRFKPTDRETVNALDLGCGSGFLSLVLAELGCRTTGIDFSNEMLAQARANALEKGFADATFKHMEAQHLDFPDNSFDYIVSRNVTWTLEDVDHVYKQVMRVLKPQGVFLNIDANYGRLFNEADEQGIAPSHPTQTLEQLRRRNDIAHDLPITLVDRPQWDMIQLWNLGAARIECYRDFQDAAQVASASVATAYAPTYTGVSSAAAVSPLFALVAWK